MLNQKRKEKQIFLLINIELDNFISKSTRCFNVFCKISFTSKFTMWYFKLFCPLVYIGASVSVGGGVEIGNRCVCVSECIVVSKG